MILRPQLLLFALLVMSVLALPLAAQNAEVRLETTPAIAHPGETVLVEVFLDVPTGVTIGGGELAIEFDRSIFTLTSLSLPSDIPGALVPDVFSWNAPAPIGPGGITGCSTWWDGIDEEAISASFAFAGGVQPAGEPFLQFNLQITNSAPNGTVFLGEPVVDFSCLWSGSFFADLGGGVVPTLPPSAAIAITDVLEPTDLACAGVGGVVNLSWSNDGLYDAIEIFRDDVLIASIDGAEESYLDDLVAIGQSYDYTVIAQFQGTESPPVFCTAVVSDVLGSPENLFCADSGAGDVDLSWTLPPETLDGVTVTRNGALIATLAGTATTYTDVAPPTGVNLDYEVRAVLATETSDPATCSVMLEVDETLFVRGDANLDGSVDVADAITILGYLFSGDSLNCFDASDTNDDGSLNVADAITLIEFLFAMGPAIPPPNGAPGVDPTEDDLDCVIP